jgi:hypothetical protein
MLTEIATNPRSLSAHLHRAIVDVFRGHFAGRRQTTNDEKQEKGQNSASQSVNVQEAIRFQTYYPNMLPTFRLSPLFRRSDGLAAVGTVLLLLT